ncbi:MAG: isoaspartyl peptidase/L-asparaginase family protein [Flavobacteriales bacterium]
MRNFCQVWAEPVMISALWMALMGCSTPEAPVSERLAPEGHWTIAIHGGAGHFAEENLSPDMQAAYRDRLDAALRLGEDSLQAGSRAVDVVEWVIRQLEDDSLFNAGRGAVYTADGVHELDASIADGAMRNCGAITGLRGFRHPISVARQVMDSSEHVFFSGHGAAQFAGLMQAERAHEEWFRTEKALARFLRADSLAQGQLPEVTSTVSIKPMDKNGTVGCVVLDTHGHLAAGTSTGGMTYKKHGRIGDSPVIGAGTWADDRTCAVSATGWGEYFIRAGVAQDIHGRMLHGGESLVTACEGAVFDEMGALGGDGGVVAVDARGNVALVFNSKGMFRAWAGPNEREVAMFGFSESGTIEQHQTRNTNE